MLFISKALNTCRCLAAMAAVDKAVKPHFKHNSYILEPNIDIEKVATMRVSICANLGANVELT